MVEIVRDFRTDTFRAIYTVRFAGTGAKQRGLRSNGARRRDGHEQKRL